MYFSSLQILGTGMDTQDTSPSVLLFFDKQRFIFNAGEVSVGWQVYKQHIFMPSYIFVHTHFAALIVFYLICESICYLLLSC